MPTKFEPSPEERAAILQRESEFKPLCTVVVYRFQQDGEIIYTVNVKMEPLTPELESSDYHFALDAIADSIRNIQTGKLEPANIC